MSYELLDSGGEHKLERFGDYTLVRPAAQAVWKPQLPVSVWNEADGRFTREKGNKWVFKRKIPATWTIKLENLILKISPTEFGHLGVFPEHSLLWKWMEDKIKPGMQVLNLFAYSGGATLAAARAGAKVCHLDASKGMVAWARENCALNKMEKDPIRWIVEDVIKFLQREIKRGNRYEGIILDPPSFGRGNRGEIFKIEQDFQELLTMCRTLLSDDPSFFILSCHTPGFTPIVLNHVLKQTMGKMEGTIETGEMIIPGPLDLPSGSYGRWSRDGYHKSTKPKN